MKPLLPTDLFLVRSDRSKEGIVDMKTPDGIVPIYIDGDFAPYSQATQCCEIVHCPSRLTPLQTKTDQRGNDYTEGYYNDTELKDGDKIFVHHFVVNDDNYVELNGERLYKCFYSDIYAVERDGEIIPLEKWIFTSPIVEKEADIQKSVSGIILLTKPTTGIIPLRARVEYVGKQAIEQGLKPGDEIIYRPDADYEMKINDRALYRMNLDDVFGVIQ